MTTPEDPFRTGDSPPAAPPTWSASGSYGYSAPAYGPPPVQGYGPPPLAGYSPPRDWGPAETDSKAVIALCLAIGSFVVLPFVLAIAALVVASSSQRDIDASGGRLTGDSLNTAAKVVSWINLALCALVVVAAVAFVALFATAGFS